MHTWTDLATPIGDLLTLTTATLNLATAALQTRHRRRDGGHKPEQR